MKTQIQKLENIKYMGALIEEDIIESVTGILFMFVGTNRIERSSFIKKSIEEINGNPMIDCFRGYKNDFWITNEGDIEFMEGVDVMQYQKRNAEYEKYKRMLVGGKMW